MGPLATRAINRANQTNSRDVVNVLYAAWLYASRRELQNEVIDIANHMISVGAIRIEMTNAIVLFDGRIHESTFAVRDGQNVKVILVGWTFDKMTIGRAIVQPV